MRGKFIVVDGGEGAGKTTLICAFEEMVPSKKILFACKPGGSSFCEPQ